MLQTYSGPFGFGDAYIDLQTPYLGTEIERLHGVVQSQLQAMLSTLGRGVRRGFLGELAVTAGTGLSITVGSGLAGIGLTTAPCAVFLFNAYPIDNIEANRGEANPLYFHVGPLVPTLDDAGVPRGDSLETRTPMYRFSDLDDLSSEGFVRLARITTSASAVLTVVDMRQYSDHRQPAATNTLGLVRMNSTPASAASPIAVGPNDPLVDVVNRTANTTLSDNDSFGFYDSAVSAYRRISRANLRIRLFLDLFTAKGGILVGTAANSATMLTVGTNNQVPVADSSLTAGIKWATLSASLVSDFTNAAREAVRTSTQHGFYNATAINKPTVSGKKGSPAQAVSLLSALGSLGLVTDSTTGNAPTGTGRFQRPILMSGGTPSGVGFIQESAYTLPFAADGSALTFQLRGVEWYVDAPNTGAPSLKIERFSFNAAKTTRTQEADLTGAIALAASTYLVVSPSASTTNIASGDMLRINVTTFPANSPSRWMVRLLLEEV